MCSTPLTFCSSGRGTVSTRVLALAPGYRVVTCTVGGTTLGYCEVGNWMSATRPIRTKNNASTLASTGRSMKKREIMPARPEGSLRRRIGGARLAGVCRLGRGRRQGDSLRIDLGPGKSALSAFGHHPVAGVESGLDDPKLALPRPSLHNSALDNIVGVDDQDVAAFLAGPKRIVSGQQRLVLLRDGRPHPHEQARQQRGILVLKQGARRQRAAGKVDLGRGVVEMSLVRIAVFAGEPDLDRDVRQV